MTDIEIRDLGTGKIALISPYNPDMPDQARTIGGRWNSADRCWQFDARDEQRVRDLARRIYGTDGSAEAAADLVTIRLDISDMGQRRGDNHLYVAGRSIVRRPGRDDTVLLGAGVILISGGFPGSAGSMRYPSLEPKAGTVVEIRDLPRAALEQLEAETYEVVDTQVDATALLQERARLLARIAEIDATLTDAGHQAPATDSSSEPQPAADVARAVPAADTRHVLTITLPVPAGADGVSTSAYAAAIGRSARTVRRWAASGHVTAVRTSSGWIITA